MDTQTLEKRLLAELLAQWGYVMGSAGLRQALGFPTQAALRQSISKKTVPVPVFSIPGRKGPFALSHDVARWLASRGAALSPEGDLTIPNPKRRKAAQ
jgi:hypothetical protein